MKKCIYTELWKAFFNKWFFNSLLVGVFISMINVVENIVTVKELSPYLINSDGSTSGGYQGFSLFINWIAVNGTSFGNRVFLFVWPILAAMPYGWSYFQERRTGVYNQLVARCGIKNYFVSKFFAVFMSGGVVIAIPILLNLLVNALICPFCVPKVISSLVMIFDGNFLSEVFYTRPWIHAFVWCGVVFLFGGAVACMSFLVGIKPQLQVMVVLTPFAVLVLIDGIYTVMREVIHWNLELSPLRLVVASSAYQTPEWAVFSVIGLLLFGSFVIGYWQVKKHELG